MIEEISILHFEPEIQFQRRWEIRVQTEEEEEINIMDVEVVYMIEHYGELFNLCVYKPWRRVAPSNPLEEEEEEISSGSSSADDDDQEKENPLFTNTTILAQAQKQMQR